MVWDLINGILNIAELVGYKVVKGICLELVKNIVWIYINYVTYR